MSPAEAIRVIFRHWLIIGLGLIITVMGTTYAYLNIPNAYSSTSVVMLLQKPTTTTKVGENPYLSMDASLTVTASAVQRAVSDSPAMALALDTPSSRGTFLITPVMSGPFLQIDTEAASKANTLMIQQIVRAEMRTTLTTLQSSVGAPSSLQIQLNEVTQPSKAKAVLKRKLQFVGGILFGGLGLTTSIAFLAERIRSNRQARKTATSPSPETTGPEATAPEEAAAETAAPAITPDPPATAARPPRTKSARPTKSTKVAKLPPTAVAPELRLRPIAARPAPGDERAPGQTGMPRFKAPAAPAAPAAAVAPVRNAWRAPVQRQLVQTRNGVNGFPAPPDSPRRAWDAMHHLLRVPTDPDRA